MVEIKNVNKTLVRKPEQKRPFEKPRSKWEYNIKMDLREIECGLYSASLGKSSVADFHEYSNEPSENREFLINQLCNY
jgi:hypothetical protein